MDNELDTTPNVLANSEVLRLKIVDAADAMDCSVATVYNRAKEHSWTRGKDSKGAWVEIPEDFLPSAWVQEYKAKNALEETNADTPLPSSELIDQLLEKMVEKLDEKYKEALESKEREVKSHQATIEALNNQIAAQNNQLVVLKEKNNLKSQAEIRAEIEAELKPQFTSLANKPKGFWNKLAYLFSEKE